MSSILKPKVPAAPSPTETINAQAEANRITQFTPQGTLQYGTVDDQGNFVASQGGNALQVTESPFNESIRLGGEQLSLGLLNQLLAQNNQLLQPRDISSIEAGLSDFGGFQGLGQNADQLLSVNQVQQVLGQNPQTINAQNILSKLTNQTIDAGNIAGGLPAVSTDFSGEAKRLEQATFDAAANRLTPRFEDQREVLEQRLADQGIPIGSEAYQEEINRLEESQNEQLSRLSLDSVAAGRAEQDRLSRLEAAMRDRQLGESLSLANLESGQRGQQLQEGLSLAGLQSALRGQDLNQQLQLAGLAASNRRQQFGEGLDLNSLANALRGQQLQEQLGFLGLEQQNRAAQFGELGSVLGFSQPFTQFNVPQINAAGIMQAGYENDLNRFNMKQQSNFFSPQNMQQMAQVAALAASDKRLKTDIVKVGERNGYNLYEFSYKTEPSIRYRGVMADEVKEINPDAVQPLFGSDYDAVDYGKIGIKLERLNG